MIDSCDRRVMYCNMSHWQRYSLFCVILMIVVLNVICDENEMLDNRPILLLERVKDGHGKLELSIQNPDSIAPVLPITGQRQAVNVSCRLRGGGLESNSRVALTYVRDWNSNGMSDVDYQITKATFKIKVEPQGYIQCGVEGEGYGNVTSDEKLYRNKYQDSYTMQVSYSCNSEPCKDAVQISQDIEKSFREINKSIRFIPIQETELNGTIVLTLRCEKENLQIPESSAKISQSSPVDIDESALLSLREKASKYNAISTAEMIVDVQSTRYCHRDNGSWPATRLGLTATKNELCTDEDGGLIVRKCSGDFITGAKWEEIDSSVKCSKPRPSTLILYKLSTKTQTPASINATLTILENELDSKVGVVKENRSSVLSEADVNNIADIFTDVAPHMLMKTELKSVCRITSKLMEIQETYSKADILKTCQSKFNSSNKILESLDQILNGVQLETESKLVVTDRFITYIADLSPESEGFRGLAVLRRNGKDNFFRTEDIKVLDQNDTLATLLSLDINAAVLIPPSLYNIGSRRIVINFFYDDSLFGSNNQLGEERHAVSVTLDGKRHEELSQPLVLAFRRPEGSGETAPRPFEGTNVNSPCVFWDFETNSGAGDWSSAGCVLGMPANHSTPLAIDICVCTHLTHFAELLREFPSTSPVNHYALDIITVCGCILSLFGLIGIAVTALVFPEWRKGANKKIQLNLSLSLFLLMISFLTGSLTKHSGEIDGMVMISTCMGSGIVLHYSIIASFCWMIVAAWGQYLRLTKPLESLSRKPHYVLKSCVFAWGLPLVPITTSLLLDVNVYAPPNCYPSGHYLYFAVVVPVILAVSLNATIFIYILLSIFQCCGLGLGLVHLRNNQISRSIALRKLATAVFLFLLLGLSWVFGILNWSYVFCITATMQGFAVFIFFVVLDKTTRAKWNKKMLGMKQEELRTYSHSSSADFIRRWSGRNRYSRSFVTTQISNID